LHNKADSSLELKQVPVEMPIRYYIDIGQEKGEKRNKNQWELKK
jgi:hypothetical protein